MRFPSEKVVKRRKGSSAAGRRATRNQLRFETLENRQLLAGVPELLREINSSSEPIGSNPESFVQVGAISYFTASTTTTGRELWKSDGTEAGTVRVKDIWPGSESSDPEQLINVNGTLYFSANDGTNGRELWKSNGTEVGTVRVKDIRSGPFGSGISKLTNVNGTLFFNANDGLSGFELWKSNGSEIGTVRVKDIRLGSGSSYVETLANVNGTLFFSARSTTTGYELWKSNGTEAGTVLVKAGFNGGAFYGSGNPNNLTNVNGTLFFVANDGTSGVELWKSNGIAGGTVRVKDIRSGTNSSFPSSLTNVNGTLYFSANDGANGTELWKSNGTTAGTVPVKNIHAGAAGSNPAYLTNVNGTLFFTANDGVNGGSLWKSNGTEASTVRINIAGSDSATRPTNLLAVNGMLFFSAFVSPNGRELWKSNGTDTGTVLVKDIHAGAGFSSPTALANVNGTLFFRANNGAAGYEVWKSSGTAAGTVQVKDIHSGAVGSSARNLVNVNGTMFFSANDPTHGTELWKTNGTIAGTVRVKDINPGPVGSNPNGLINLNGTLFFTATDGIDSGLWKSDGTEAGTVLVSEKVPNYLTNVNGTLFFSAYDDTNGSELWKSNGTAAGTVLVKDIFPGGQFIFAPNSSRPRDLINVNGTLFFTANDGTSGIELWKSNGTELGTVRVRDIGIGTLDSKPSQLINVNGTLFFRIVTGTGVVFNSYTSLWKSNGTAGGTVQVSESVSNVDHLSNVNGTLFFSARGGSNGTELWKTNGTSAGTVLVKDIRLGVASSTPRNLTNVNGTLFFSADDGSGGDEGSELWKSNGLNAGTVRVKEIFTGAGSSNPFFLTNGNGKLFFRANNGVNGQELWESDGTVAGTQMVSDIVQGSGGSDPELLTEFNGNLLFTANTETLGRELWILRSGAAMHSVAIEAASATKNEGQSVSSPFTFTVTRSGSLNAATVNYAVTGTGASPATAADFVGSVLPSGVVTFEAGQATRVIAIPVREDKSVEANESFQVTLSGATGGATIVAATATGSILNDDTSLAIAATDAIKTEGNVGSIPFTFTITRTGDLSGTNSVNYAVTGFGTNPAIVDDFISSVLPNGIASFAVGQATRLITIPIRPDKLVEADESFRVTISNATEGATITRASADGLIINDDAPPAPSLAIAATSASKNEGSGTGTAFTFTVTRSKVLTGATTVNYAVTGFGASPATAEDFVGGVMPSGVVSFAAGQETRVISIPVRGDTTVEPNESFGVTLSNASGGATLTTATANGLIRNDDSVLVIAATSASKNEGNGATTAFTFTVTRTGFLTGAATVNYAVTGFGQNPVTAADFVGGVLPSGVVSFAVGQTSLTITIPVIGDSIAEADEEFRVTLSGASVGSTLATATANGLIRNDDTGLAIAATSASKNEGNDGTTLFTFTVTRTGLLTGTTVINYAVTGQGVNPATNTDFLNNVLPRGTVAFAAGETTKVISILVNGDAVVEADEGFLVTLSGARLGTSLITALASGLIRNDDV